MRRLILAVPVVVVGLLVAAVTAAWAGDRDATGLTDELVVVASPAVTPPGPTAPSATTTDPATTAAGPQADPGWVTRVAASTGIAPRALTAYAAASLRMQDEQPGCRLGWTSLAGIGEVETGHGQGTLDADGRSTGAIEGPALDGTDGNAAISEDGSWDRARGPMQFIASTWEQWAADGDGDGTADVDDVDDAAYAAARYLCASGADLTTAAGWTSAIHSYNHSDDYVRAVLAAANTYAARSTAG